MTDSDQNAVNSAAEQQSVAADSSTATNGTANNSNTSQQSSSSQQTQSGADTPETSASTPAPANASQGGREINKKVLYVGNIDQQVAEDTLNDVFKTVGNVVSIKIFPDKNKRGFNYAFIEYEDQAGAELAYRSLDGRPINQSVSLNFSFIPFVVYDLLFFFLYSSTVTNMQRKNFF